MSNELTDAIDIPPPSSRIFLADEKLPDAPVVVHFNDGKISRGTLKVLSYARKNLLLQMPGGPVLLAFSKISYLSFSQRIRVRQAPRDSMFASPNTKRDKPFQVFKVSLANGQIISGKMKTASVDEGGIHVFKLFDPEHAVRLFFVAEAVSDYQLGDLIGEALVKAEKLTKETLDEALEVQKKQRQQKIGDFLLSTGVINSEQLEKSLNLQRKEKENSADGSVPPKLGEILVAEGMVTQETMDSVLVKQSTTRGKKIGEYLIDMGVADSSDIQIELAKKLNRPFIKLTSQKPNAQALGLVPRDIAEKHQLVPLKVEDGKLLVAVDDPLNKEIDNTLRFITNLPVELVIATSEDIRAAIPRLYDEALMREDIDAAESLHQVFELDSDQRQELKELGQDDSSAPIVRLVTRLIIDAIKKRASDIHIRPKKEDVDLLFRMDGELVKIRSFKKSLLSPIISRIKIIGKMDISERRLPQDGGAQVIQSGSEVDLRISIMPTIEGESAVIRLLNSQAGLQSIADLGFNKIDAETFADMMHKSFGLVLVTGPTGSGKSTTLYAALKEVITRNLNIITVENPVEYHIDGIEQIQVNTVPGYTFAKALRHILRHDPDVIMIGEIRDEETAKIAIESALTGHLVLSTLHTNDASGAVTRLLEMGVDPYLLEGTLLGIFAQRLVRRNCPSCLAEEDVEPALKKALRIDEDETFYKGAGCESCNFTGYKGRIAAYELLKFSSELQRILNKDISTQEVHSQAVKDGMTPLTDNALALARAKTTSLAEVYRVRLE